MVSKVLVVGAGLMGTGIAQVAAEAGCSVRLYDVDSKALEKASGTVRRLLARKVDKGSLKAEEADQIAQRIQPSTWLDENVDVDLAIEAVPEKLQLKGEVFKKLDQICPQDSVLASNTSGLPITLIASATRRPDKVVGMHFFYPPQVMKLVEVVKGVCTSSETVQIAHSVAEQFGKTPVDAPDYPGFLVNRMLIPMINEAIYCVMEGADPEAVDAAMQLGANHPMGPIKLADFVGLDTLLATMEGLYDGFKDSKYRPCPLLVKKVQAGHLGRKTGRGFYVYEEPAAHK